MVKAMVRSLLLLQLCFLATVAAKEPCAKVDTNNEEIQKDGLITSDDTNGSFLRTTRVHPAVKSTRIDMAGGERKVKESGALSELFGADNSTRNDLTGGDGELFNMLNNSDVPDPLAPEEAVYPDYLDFSSIAGLTLNGDASQAGNILQLTPNEQQKRGSAFFTEPISLAGGASFQAEFRFQLRGGTLGADGFTFAFQNDPSGPAAIGQAGSGMGYDGITKSAAVKFDTYQSTGVEFSRVDIVAGSNDIANGDAPVDLNSGDTYNAWVDYGHLQCVGRL